MILLLACAHRPAPEEAPASRASPSGTAELVHEGSPAERVSREKAEIVLFYSGEQMGNMGTCGCPSRPLGGLARAQSLIEASQAAWPTTPTLLVNGGYWLQDATGLDGSVDSAVAEKNRWMIRGMEAMGVDAANVAPGDIAGLAMAGELPPWAISANVEGIPDSRVVEVGGRRVGVVGITGFGYTMTPAPGFRITDPYEGGLSALKALSGEVDTLVLLAYGCSEVAAKLAQAVPEVDVVVDTNMHHGFFEPEAIGGAVWVRSDFEGRRLGELRLDGSDELVRDRKIDLDETLPDDPEVGAIAAAAALGQP